MPEPDAALAAAEEAGALAAVELLEEPPQAARPSAAAPTPAAAQNHLIPPHLSVLLCAEKILLQRVKVELSEFLRIVHFQCFKVFDEQGRSLVRVQKVQNIVAVDHIDRIDLFLLYQPGITLEQAPFV